MWTTDFLSWLWRRASPRPEIDAHTLTDIGVMGMELLDMCSVTAEEVSDSEPEHDTPVA